MYATGRGVPQDYVQAHMWINLAASRPTGEERETAAELRDLLRTQMTPEQIAEAQRLAREWDLAHPRNP
jgi:TPR repeat protein